MFESSKDILYIVLAFCILWLTIFLSWFLFYAISIAKNLRWFIKGAKDNVANVVKTIERSIAHLGFLSDAVKRLLSYFIEKNIRGKKRKK